MKSITLFSIALLMVFSLNAQNNEKTEIRVNIEKDGKVIKDSLYFVDKDVDMNLISRIIDMTLSDNQPGKNQKLMIIKSEDGKIHKFDTDSDLMHTKHGDKDHSSVYITKEKNKNGDVEVIIIERDSLDNEKHIIKTEDKDNIKAIHSHGEKPIWLENGKTKVLIIDTNDGHQKKIKVVSDTDSDYSIKTEDGETIIIQMTEADESKKELRFKVIVEEEENHDSKKDKKHNKRNR